MSLSFAEVDKILRYDSESGFFFWKTSHSRRIHPGDKAGWLDKGYLRIKICGRMYSAQNLAWLLMTGIYPNQIIDHRNKIKDDNRWSNLRLASKEQNIWNRTVNTNNKSTGYKNVYKYNSSKKKRIKQYLVCVTAQGKRYTKSFSLLEEANTYAMKLREKFHGDFASD